MQTSNAFTSNINYWPFSMSAKGLRSYCEDIYHLWLTNLLSGQSRYVE